MQGSFFSNAAVFFLLFLIARTRTCSPCFARFSHGQPHTGTVYWIWMHIKSHASLSSGTSQFSNCTMNFLTRSTSSQAVKLWIFCIFYTRVLESFESHTHASHITLPLGGTVHGKNTTQWGRCPWSGAGAPGLQGYLSLHANTMLKLNREGALAELRYLNQAGYLSPCKQGFSHCI